MVVSTADPNGGADLRVALNGDSLVLAAISALNDPAGLTLVASTLAGPDNPAIVAAVLAQNADYDPTDPFLWGRYISGYCEDEITGVSSAGVAAAAVAYPLLAAYAHDPFLEICNHWPTQQRSKVIGYRGAPGTVPALILSGGLSPFSPPDYAQQAAKTFKDATVAVFPSLTAFVLQHGPPCVAALRLDFLRDPLAKLDIEGCIAQVPPVKFEGT